MPVEDGYLHTPSADLFWKKLDVKRIGLYGLFVRPDQGDDWLIGIFDKHVLVFGVPPLEVEIINLKDERHKTLKRYPMSDACFRLHELQENEYGDVDHIKVLERNQKRLFDSVANKKGCYFREIFVDRGLYFHHGLQIKR